MIRRGDIHWVDLGEPVGSRPAERRPVLVVQSRPHNDSRLATILALVVTSSTGLAAMPGTVFLPAVATGLPRDSVADVTALVTLNKHELTGPAGHVPEELMRGVDRGLRRLPSL